MNFAADFAAIPVHLALTSELGSYTNETDPTKKLSRARELLQQTAQDWLIILDNADDLDQFRNGSNQAMSIAGCLPRSGRLLITSRDECFVGAVSKVQNAERVLPMDTDVARDLILTSIPSHLVQLDHPPTQRAMTELLEKLGNLPLAIAQAAANIHDRQSNLTDYVNLYRDKERRVAEAKAFRQEHVQEISRAETVHGHLDDRLGRDADEKRIYDEASHGLHLGTIERGDSWWESNQDVLEITERRYGKIAHNAAREEIQTVMETNEEKPQRSKRWLRLPTRKREDGLQVKTASPQQASQKRNEDG